MTSFALLMLLSARQVSLASPGWSSPNVDEKRVTFFADHLAAQLSLAGLRVITQTEVVQALALERQKALIGCSTDSCLSEISDALGADGLITGTVAKVGKRLALTLKIVASNNGRALALYDNTVGSEAELVDLLTEQAPRIAEEVRVAVLGKPAPGPGVRRFWWLPTALGGAALVAGTTFTGLSWARYAALDAKEVATVGSDPVAYAQTGKTFQTAGLITASIGVAALLSGLLMYALAPEDAPALSLSIGPAGASVFVRW